MLSGKKVTIDFELVSDIETLSIDFHNAEFKQEEIDRAMDIIIGMMEKSIDLDLEPIKHFKYKNFNIQIKE